MTPSIRVDDLWKEYRIGGPSHSRETLYDVLSEFVRAPFHTLRQRARRTLGDERFWALREVGFEIEPGEVLGIIGKNGAGKSTLLKILSRITDPTRGRIEIRGRLASLLEVGTGFHPELTGRENIYLNGAILGMTRREIARKFDEIVAFAEVDKFLDTPVKRYSSGMYVRLAFAVAAHLDPDILVVDEVLAVGDASFQEKCLAKMKEVRSGGRTVLFVSHNLTAIQALCSRALWLERGAEHASGFTSDVVSSYLNHNIRSETHCYWDSPDEAPGDHQVRLRSALVRPSQGNSPEEIRRDSPVEIVIEYWNLIDGARLHVSLQLLDEHGQIVFNTIPLREVSWFGRQMPKALFRSSCTVPPHLLNSGSYRIGAYIVRDQTNLIFGADNLLRFLVLDVPEPRLAWHGKWTGVVRPELEWHTELIAQECP